MSSELDERREMVHDFVTESREMLDDIEPQILALEKHASQSGDIDDEILNTIFRLFHSLKGMASFLDLQTVMQVTHEAETLLDIFRKRQMPMEGEHVELLCRTSDFVRELLDVIEQRLSDNGYEDAAGKIIGEIQTKIHDGRNSDKGVEAPKETVVCEAVNEIAQVASEESVVSEPVLEFADEFKLTITPEMIKRFTDEAMDTFEEAESTLLQMELRPNDKQLIEQVFRSFHSFKGNAGFFGYADFEKLSHKAENLLDSVRDGRSSASPAIISILLSVVDVLRIGVHGLEKGELVSIPNLPQLLRSMEEVEAGPVETVDVESKNFPDITSKESEKPIERPVQQKNNESSDKADKEDGQDAPAGGARSGGADKKSATASQMALRVDVEKLDQLLDLVGEMVISVSMVSNSPDLVGLNLDRFEKSIMHLTKITRDIQDVSMSMRMIPLSGVFRKMVRLVRDVAMKENKKVDLEIIGEETEVDKTIIEQISDPLVHLIRNAVDHGVEAPTARVAAGKPETGRVTLEAKHSAGEVWILIKDDGNGINRDKLIKKAIERGITNEDAYGWKDEDVYKLVFEPGLSTAAQVSSISGRGVGMDVVKRNIEKLRGRIDIRSTPGTGTIFILRIPLTLAIIDGMIVQVGDIKYAIPITSINESLRPAENQITVTPEGLELLNVRHQLLPVIRLHEIYKVKRARTKLTEGILIVVEHDLKKYCLFVDEMVGQHQIVIKGLPEYFGRIRGVSGFAILGDGEISTILDIAGLVGSMEGLLADVRH
jgi:two-component system chemotaxis sensor kinase CheA